MEERGNTSYSPTICWTITGVSPFFYTFIISPIPAFNVLWLQYKWLGNIFLMSQYFWFRVNECMNACDGEQLQPTRKWG